MFTCEMKKRVKQRMNELTTATRKKKQRKEDEKQTQNGEQTML